MRRMRPVFNTDIWFNWRICYYSEPAFQLHVISSGFNPIWENTKQLFMIPPILEMASLWVAPHHMQCPQGNLQIPGRCVFLTSKIWSRGTERCSILKQLAQYYQNQDRGKWSTPACALCTGKAAPHYSKTFALLMLSWCPWHKSRGSMSTPLAQRQRKFRTGCGHCTLHVLPTGAQPVKACLQMSSDTRRHLLSWVCSSRSCTELYQWSYSWDLGAALKVCQQFLNFPMTNLLDSLP